MANYNGAYLLGRLISIRTSKLLCYAKPHKTSELQNYFNILPHIFGNIYKSKVYSLIKPFSTCAINNNQNVLIFHPYTPNRKIPF